MGKSKKYYAVWAGHRPGVYDSWQTCQMQIKNFPGAKYKSFKTEAEAEEALSEPYKKHIGNSTKKKQSNSGSHKGIIKQSVSVDAACSGNPGIMEYRGVHTGTKEEIFYQGPYKDGTNNIGEFLALVHALALFKKLNNNTIIYTDSRTAMAWVKNKKVKTTLKKNARNAVLFDLMDRAIKWLNENTYTNTILKWDTKNWGEIPADFGRK
ncbi:MAG: ribonuclease H family protein [Saprospiraceae bacterium]|nr:ribonuclease H family protein [Saprospiraceae bacterium]